MSLSIGQLSKKSDVPIDTIRYYEKVGVLDRIQRSENNYRIYTDQTLTDLLFIKHCRELDISLNDIKTLKQMKAQPKQACTEVDNLVNKYLIEVSEKIERLLLLKETLIDLKQHCSTDRTVDECGILKELQNNL
ncbi:Cd(II)/Pb(II)-responsive transcriptional regulator [Acinetobacter seifertii]|uniref:Cd(II)/Pb(II)-responsive transcriptional regulator n=2 Tax=Acinetobacter TaxID=469 RepID=A0A7H2R0B6_9GAMM|nr:MULTISPECIES: Cd(II)/Pb(II)-responsive transcriptional regulator [Acinetobacter]MBD1225770.1 Cd(II)/Pb(II)-responsive transcriptional regulator [Acinetobacter seifertii]MDB0281344.1 Cd(II)/Pb(II)-responsive transcriptional regulator [Acinetobacter seifertii]ONN51449.1 MerR family transcriptional regulator [Acinetobacter genomosp. 33YU]QNX11299.1 Cd(II)/Pb(II)-responsive transcriptional regulator [Acinetobacter seifertii]QNX20799.1 Cd(II)/Pb(II)-responsive transcriptional regulator [Acinetob